MSPRKRKILITILAGVLAFLMIFPTILSIILSASAYTSGQLSSQAESMKQALEELQSQADEIASQKQAMQTKIDDTEAKHDSALEYKQTLDQQIELTLQQIDNTNLQIERYDQLIDSNEEKLVQAKQDEADRLAQYKTRIRAMEENGDISYWSILFSAASFSDLLDRLDLIGEIAEYDQNMLDELEIVRQNIIDATNDLEDSKSRMEEQQTNLSTQQSDLETERTAEDEYIQSLEADADTYSQYYEEIEAEEASTLDEINEKTAAYEAKLSEQEEQQRIEEEALRKEAERAAAASSESGSGSYYSSNSASVSGFLWPLPSGCNTISCVYGYRIHPITGKYSFHNGVDISVSTGTNVYASKAGTVITSQWNTAYGNYVVISHGDGVSTLYAHLSELDVSVGDYVIQGETIGLSGSTGWSTGPHLHFTIFVNGESVNPMDYF